MKRIKVVTKKELICEVDYSGSTLHPDRVEEFIKKENMIPKYDESYTDMKKCVIQFFVYIHAFVTFESKDSNN